MSRAGETVRGVCLCGAVRFSAVLESAALQACHCVQCQRWTGGGPFVSATVSGFEIEDGEAVSAWRASAWGERGNCRRCGSPVWWRMQGKPITSVAAGALDDQSGLSVKEEIFIERRAPWLRPWPDAAQSTEAEQLSLLEKALAEKEA